MKAKTTSSFRSLKRPTVLNSIIENLFAGAPSSEVSRTGKLWVYGVLMCLSVLAYANTLPNELILDDKPVILRNPLIQNLGSLPTVFVKPFWTHKDTYVYRPIPLVTFGLNRAIGGVDPTGYHVLNIVLHGLVVICLYSLGMRLGLSQTGNFLSAAIFAVHPIHTEAVGPIVGRAELFMSLGTFLALIMYIDSWKYQDARKLKYLFASIGVFAMASLSKEQGMVFPFLLILYDLSRPTNPVTSLRKNWQHCILRYAGYFITLGIVLAVRHSVLGSAVFKSESLVPFLDNPLAHLDWIARLPGAISVAGRYLGLFLWPADLSADYSYNAFTFPSSFWAPASLTMIFVIGAFAYLAAWSYRSGGRRAFFAIGFTACTFAPAANILIPIGTIMGERLFYLPSAGLCLLTAMAFDWLVDRYHLKARRHIATALTVLMVVILGLGVLRTVYRNRDWRNTESLTMSGLATYPNSAKWHMSLAAVQIRRGDLAAALNAYREAMVIYPDYPLRAWRFAASLGAVMIQLGNHEEGILNLRRAIRLKPDYLYAHYSLGHAYLKTDDWAKAREHFRKVLELAPSHVGAKKGLAIAEAKQKKGMRQ